MKRYDYLYMTTGETGIHLWATEKEILLWCLAEIKKHVPECRIDRHRKDKITEEPRGFRIHNLDKKDMQLGDWLFVQLLGEGWLPTTTPKDVLSRLSDGRYGSFTLVFLKETLTRTE